MDKTIYGQHLGGIAPNSKKDTYHSRGELKIPEIQ